MSLSPDDFAMAGGFLFAALGTLIACRDDRRWHRWFRLRRQLNKETNR